MKTRPSRSGWTTASQNQTKPMPSPPFTRDMSTVGNQLRFWDMTIKKKNIKSKFVPLGRKKL